MWMQLFFLTGSWLNNIVCHRNTKVFKTADKIFMNELHARWIKSTRQTHLTRHIIFDTWRHRTRSQTSQSHCAAQGESSRRERCCWRFLVCVFSRTLNSVLAFAPTSLAKVAFGHEQRRGSVHGPEAGVRPMLQPLVRRQVPEGGPQRRPVHRELPEVPALRAEGHQREGHSHRRRGVHGPQQGQARELMGHDPAGPKILNSNRTMQKAYFVRLRSQLSMRGVRRCWGTTRYSA